MLPPPEDGQRPPLPALDAARDAVIETRDGKRFELGDRVEARALNMLREMVCHALSHLRDARQAVEAGSRIQTDSESETT